MVGVAEACKGELEERDDAFVAPAAEGQAKRDGAIERAVRAEAESGGGVVALWAVREGPAVEFVLQREAPFAGSPPEMGAEAAAAEVMVVPDREVELAGAAEGE